MKQLLLWPALAIGTCIAVWAIHSSRYAPSRTISSNISLVAVRDGPELLRQCSRVSPEFDSGSLFQPSTTDIQKLESALSEFLLANEQHFVAYSNGIEAGLGKEQQAISFAVNADAYDRQYIGFSRNSRRYIYGNFLPLTYRADRSTPITEPAIICDGGPDIFGVQYDIETARIVMVDFNQSPWTAPLYPLTDKR